MANPNLESVFNYPGKGNEFFMNAKEILSQLKALGQENYRKILIKHGAKDPIFGVKVEELKKFQKQIKKDYALALELFASGNYDAMYLAGLIADDARMTKKDLQLWAETGKSWGILQYTVAWVAAESNHGWEMALEWIDSKEEGIALAGWSTLSSLVAIKDDEDLDLPALKKLLKRVEKEIHKQPGRIPYAMNGFVIALGSYVQDLTDAALQAGEKIGKVEVDMGDTECKVPLATDYINKVIDRGTIGKKRKTAKC